MEKKYNLISVYSHTNFDKMMNEIGVNDENVENKFGHLVFISIIGTDECQKYYLEEEEKHWFKENHNNVLNLEFDDIPKDIVYEGHEFKTITDEQANILIKFIEDNLNKDFYVHCRAGKSRSQAVYKFMTDCYPQYFDFDKSGLKDNPCLTPNYGILSIIKHVFYEKNGLF